MYTIYVHTLLRTMLLGNDRAPCPNSALYYEGALKTLCSSRTPGQFGKCNHTVQCVMFKDNS